MKKICKLKSTIFFLIILIAFLLLFLNYYCNYFEIVDKNFYLEWQIDSELLVTNKIKNAKEFGIFNNAGLLGSYTRQIGLQGIFFSFINKIGGYKFNYERMYMFNCFTFCLFCFVILFWIKKELGKLSCIFSYFALFFSNWLIASSRNLYWVPFTFLLPFVSFLLIFMCEERKHKEYRKVVIIILAFFTIFIKGACGYEAITLVLINMEVPLIYYALKKKYSIKKYISYAFLIGISGILGFLTAVIINLIQKSFYFNSFVQAFNDLKTNFAGRTSFGDVAASDAPFEAITTPISQTIKFYFYDGYPLMFNNARMINILYFVFIIGIIVILLLNRNKVKLFNLYNFVVATFISFLGPISWHVLGFSHSWVHRHINYFLWNLPFLILLFGIIGNLTEIIINKLLKNYRKIVIVSFPVLLLFFLYCKYSYVNRFKRLFPEKAIFLCRNENLELYYLNENKSLYYIQKKEALLNRNIIKDKRIFLHIIYDKDRNAIGKDFNLSDINTIVNFPFWVDYKVNKIPLGEVHPILSIRTGEYDPISGERSWEKLISFDKFKNNDKITEIFPNGYIEDRQVKYANNIIRNGMGFISDGNDRYKELENKYFFDSNNIKRKIKSVKFVGNRSIFDIEGIPIDKNNLFLPWNVETE